MNDDIQIIAIQKSSQKEIENEKRKKFAFTEDECEVVDFLFRTRKSEIIVDNPDGKRIKHKL